VGASGAGCDGGVALGAVVGAGAAPVLGPGGVGAGLLYAFDIGAERALVPTRAARR
jgi:hypothetical protein